jgi:hypothetical protein
VTRALSPQEQEQQAQERADRIFQRLSELTFDVMLDGSWRSVLAQDLHVYPNRIKRPLSFVTFTLEPVIPTPTMPTIGGQFSICYEAFRPFGHVSELTWSREGNTSRVAFRATTETARSYLHDKLLSAMEVTYIQHGWLDESKVVPIIPDQNGNVS